MWNRPCLLLVSLSFVSAIGYGQNALDNFGFDEIRSEMVPGQNQKNLTKGTPHQRRLTALEKFPAMKQAYLGLYNSVPGLKIEFSNLGGGASFLYSLTDLLSGATAGNPEQVARQFIKAHKDLFKATEEEVDTLVVTKTYKSPVNNIQHVHLRQEIDGIEVVFSGLNIHMTDDGQIISVNGHFIPDLQSKAQALPANPAADAAESLEEALENVGLNVAVPAVAVQPSGREHSLEFAKGNTFERNITGRLVYMPGRMGAVSLGWQFVILAENDANAYMALCHLASNRVIGRHNFTSHASGLVFSGDSPTPDSPHAGSNNPTLVNRVVREFDARDNFDSIGIPAFDVTDQHFDWYAGGTDNVTISNNVKAGDDRAANDNPIIVNGQGGSQNDFSFGNVDSSVLLAGEPVTYTSASVVNLFYWCNRTHDFLYIHGFDEPSGNFQASNFGLGGQEGDVVRAEAQDGSNTDDANMQTLPDGTESRMQMFETTGQSPRRDTGFDNQVIVHEYAHGLSNRLINDAFGLIGTQAKSLGEGWSDIIALLLLSEPGDDPDAAYPIGAYALLGAFPNIQYASGIRSEPYSADPNIYTRRFGALFDFGAPHPAGELWCNALFMAKKNIQLRTGSATQAVTRLTRIIVEGLKLTPTNPTFLQARDAVFLAEQNTFGGEHALDLRQAFANMGMGFMASTTGTEDFSPVEDFTVDPAFSGESLMILDNTEFVFDPPPTGYEVGDDIDVSLQDGNAAGEITVTFAAQFSGDQETVTFSPAAGAGQFSATMPTERRFQNTVTQNDGTLQSKRGDVISATYNDADDGSGNPATLTRVVHVGLAETLLSENFDDGVANGWTLAPPWAITNEDSSSTPNSLTDSPGGNYADSTEVNATTPAIDVANVRDLVLTITHKFDLENAQDFGNVVVTDANGVHVVSSFTGTASTFQTDVIPLGDPPATGTIQIAFQLTSDAAVNADGWHIDDVVLAGLRTIPGPVPTITSISPSSIPVGATTTVTITGTNLTTSDDMHVRIGDIAGTITSASATQVVVSLTVPDGTGGISNARRARSQGITRASAVAEVVVETSDGSASSSTASFTNSETATQDTGATPGTPGEVTGAQGGSSGCFIATAAYGSPLQPELDKLRRFRDGRLVPAKMGDAFTRTYYANSPNLARRIRGSSLVRALSRKCLTPAVKCAGISR
ncbi:MAG: M36 family metallopeptidase [Planctomycetota bacterium]|nr:M36 family metallopeptidase [Planctomycetota bacterium]